MTNRSNAPERTTRDTCPSHSPNQNIRKISPNPDDPRPLPPDLRDLVTWQAVRRYIAPATIAEGCLSQDPVAAEA